MHKFILTTIIAFMATNLGLYAQEKDTAQAEPKIELKVIYEKTFDEPIVDVIFDTATVSIEEAKRMGWKEEAFTSADKSKGKVLVSYPKIVFIADTSKISYDPLEYSKCIIEIKFYRRDYELIKREAIQPWGERIIYSENGKYILRSWLPNNGYNPEKQGGTIYEPNGISVRRKDKNEFIAISCDKYLIAREPVSGPIPVINHIFYEPTGKEVVRIINPLKDKSSGYAAAKFLPGGNYAILGYTDFEKTVIILTTKEGEIIWQKEFNWVSWVPNQADMVENYGIVGKFGIKRGVHIFFIDWKGELQWKTHLGVGGNYIVKWSDDKKKVYVVTTNGCLWCLDGTNGTKLWEYRESVTPNKGQSRDLSLYSEMRIIRDTLFVIGKQNRPWHSSTLFIFDGKTGNLLKKKDFSLEKITFAHIGEKVGLINITRGKLSVIKQEVVK